MADQTEAQERVGLHNLSPNPGSRRNRKRVGRGEGSGTGKTSGRGQKGYGSRSGSKRRARFEGGQMPLHMRMRKLRGPHMKKSMPIGPFRTATQAVNLGDLGYRGDYRVDAVQGTWHTQGDSRESARKGRPFQGSEGARARLQRDGARAHRGSRRHLYGA